jgi:hypothetical protein
MLAAPADWNTAGASMRFARSEVLTFSPAAIDRCPAHRANMRSLTAGDHRRRERGVGPRTIMPGQTTAEIECPQAPLPPSPATHRVCPSDRTGTTNRNVAWTLPGWTSVICSDHACSQPRPQSISVLALTRARQQPVVLPGPRSTALRCSGAPVMAAVFVLMFEARNVGFFVGHRL